MSEKVKATGTKIRILAGDSKHDTEKNSINFKKKKQLKITANIRKPFLILLL